MFKKFWDSSPNCFLVVGNSVIRPARRVNKNERLVEVGASAHSSYNLWNGSGNIALGIQGKFVRLSMHSHTTPTPATGYGFIYVQIAGTTEFILHSTFAKFDAAAEIAFDEPFPLDVKFATIDTTYVGLTVQIWPDWFSSKV